MCPNCGCHDALHSQAHQLDNTFIFVILLTSINNQYYSNDDTDSKLRLITKWIYWLLCLTIRFFLTRWSYAVFTKFELKVHCFLGFLCMLWYSNLENIQPNLIDFLSQIQCSKNLIKTNWEYTVRVSAGDWIMRNGWLS